MAKGDELARVKVAKRQPNWKKCEYVVGFKYVRKQAMDQTCDRKALRSGLCSTHGGKD